MSDPVSPEPIQFVGAGPGDPDLLTVGALRALQDAEVILHDRLIPAAILELAGVQAQLIDVGKAGFGPATPQERINDLILHHAIQGARVVRLKAGDTTLFARLDEELATCDAAGIPWRILPGITSAAASAAALGQSQTSRGRNSSVRYLTGHDMKGFADHDWAALARPGSVAAIYMGKAAARFVQGRLLMHGADPATPVSVVENASRPDQRVLAVTLATLPAILAAADLDGPALIWLGLPPRAAALPQTRKEFA